MTFDKLRPIASAIAERNGPKARQAINEALRGEVGKQWRKYLNRLAWTLMDNVPRFGIIARNGNGKLPFLAFSSLPGEGFCPGAGECLKYCYSFRAWRYPAAFCRQAQNAWLLQSFEGREAIRQDLESAVQAIQRRNGGQSVDFRLYVDGDFRDTGDIHYWMSTIRDLPVKTYGYSKSWHELLGYDAALYATGGSWPTNYVLNVSSGSIHGPAVRNLILGLPITRGEFIAVSMGRKVQSSQHGDRQHQAELRTKFRETDGRKAFTCPGLCGSCTAGGHACGSQRFKDIPVIIAVH